MIPVRWHAGEGACGTTVHKFYVLVCLHQRKLTVLPVIQQISVFQSVASIAVHLYNLVSVSYTTTMFKTPTHYCAEEPHRTKHPSPTTPLP
jgi:hypothetical protein